jgi:hypothetical protein
MKNGGSSLKVQWEYYWFIYISLVPAITIRHSRFDFMSPGHEVVIIILVYRFIILD